MRLTVIGSSPAWPNPGGAHSGYMLTANGTRLLLDCGPGVLGRLRELELYPASIAITHFHLDHWGDLVPWAWLNAYGPQEHRIACSLWLPPGGTGQLTAIGAGPDGRLTFGGPLLAVAADAQVVLSEQIRHSILQVTHA